MCDYSAESAKRRDAEIGDEIVTGEITWHTNGMLEAGKTDTAVCLVPGTQVIFSNIPASLQKRWGIGAVATATFEQLGYADGRRSWRDAFRFPAATGRKKGKLLSDKLHLIHYMQPGLTASVECIPGQMEPVPAPLSATTTKPRRELIDA